jgi:hypothetical protein
VQRIRIRRVAPLTLGKALALVFFGFGAIAAVFGFLARGTGAEFTVGDFIEFRGVASRTTFVLVLVPFFEALYGFITGVIIAWLYNFAADRGAAIEYFGQVGRSDDNAT